MTHWHWQNLSDTPGKERHGFWHGRAWLHLGEHGRPVIHGEWSHGKLGLAFCLRFDRSESEIMLHLALPGLSWHAGVQGVPRRLFELLPMQYKREKYGGYERQIGVRVFDGSIWISLWEDPMDWRSSDPKWMQKTIHVVDLLLGKTKYQSTDVETRDVSIPMPEKSYAATAVRSVSSWIRPRWPWRPFSKRGDYVKVDIPGGIGIPGKGENSYDCGDDALFGMSCSAETIEEAIGKVVASALKTRRKYGWRPELKAVAP